MALDLLQNFRGRSEPRFDSSHARSLVETVVVVLVILVVLLIPKHTEIKVLETTKTKESSPIAHLRHRQKLVIDNTVGLETLNNCLILLLKKNL